VLYREDYGELKSQRLQSAVTDDAGRFHFSELPPPPTEKDQPRWGYALAISKRGRGSILQRLVAASLNQPLPFKLRPTATLQGRVTDSNGKPVAGALVWANSLVEGPVEGICSTRTDADGRYTITDMTAWGDDALKPKPAGKGAQKVLVGCFFDVTHPDYGQERPMYRNMPDTVDVVLQPAGAIEGRVVDQVTSKPAAGAIVCMQGTHGLKGGGWHQTRTDAQGKYRFTSLLAGKYNIWTSTSDRVCTALDSFGVEAGKKRTAPDLMLIEGGWIEGRVIDAATGKPISGKSHVRGLHVGLYGPAMPRSGSACDSSEVDEHGRFRLHVAPGVNFPYLMESDSWARTQRREYFKKGIEVRAGEVVSINFRILPTEPIPDPEPAPVRLPVPVPAERRAAALVRQLGGWYKVDADGHVIELNMVFQETPDGGQYHNDRTDTDEALRMAGAFPRLKRLYLQKGQASDEGLRSLTKLSGLEVLLVWDAHTITDAGVRHLAGLAKLREVHLSNGQLSDDSLAVFGLLPELRVLSLQGNSFADEGLKHLSGRKQLRVLHLGMSRRPISDAGVRHLSGLTDLEALDLQRATLSDAAVDALKNMKQLRTLHINGPAITDASVEHLLAMTKLRQLMVNNTSLTQKGIERLMSLADLKMFAISSSAIPAERRENLEHRRPGLQVIFCSP
jgi:hypothetical protein